ncbi:GNAT family N-acetyltransferase [Photorhabdus caribbeanensis]|uniref:GNAT family N-acetyltransferase n=1 Tax=Photorhabdus caribbeanensis TaxID=1004165 RepID=UPI001BD30BCE|nr:GNAT family N-acetyltransferase [Photorhabdus caribbeanensis]MBS9423265.1 GNAT family N-acetyltransferase [Photorhabdus caribbeanensis]
MVLKVKKFTEDEYNNYAEWFNDESISRFLGEIDTEWLDYVLNAVEISQLSFYDDNRFIGVVGIYLPNPEHNYYTILDFAINPIAQKQGYGTAIIHYLMNSDDYKETNIWKAIVSLDNKNARSFFKTNGWKYEGFEDDDYIKILFKK